MSWQYFSGSNGLWRGTPKDLNFKCSQISEVTKRSIICWIFPFFVGSPKLIPWLISSRVSTIFIVRSFFALNEFWQILYSLHASLYWQIINISGHKISLYISKKWVNIADSEISPLFLNCMQWPLWTIYSWLPQSTPDVTIQPPPSVLILWICYFRNVGVIYFHHLTPHSCLSVFKIFRPSRN